MAEVKPVKEMNYEYTINAYNKHTTRNHCTQSQTHQGADL